jgi:DNA polymerase I-like protein with 3'-5' exonuclease and polymerase domains
MQQPSHGSLGKLWRSIYIPEDGEAFYSADYSAQEPRLYTHFACLAGIPGADAFAQKWTAEPCMDVHQAVADICSIGRSQAKIIGLALAYGAGGAKICKQLGLPTERAKVYGVMREVAGPEGAALLKQYNEKFPFLRQLAKLCTRRAEQRGYVRILTGRKCRFPLENGKRVDTYKALNRLVQGSAAYQTKMAMLAADDAGVPLALAVHDELAWSGNEKSAKAVRLSMENAVKLRVPTVVDIVGGKNWGECL